jgi:hypothetical protein
MGNIRSKLTDDIDKLAHAAPPVDIFSQVAEGVDAIGQNIMFKWMDHARHEARKIALKEKGHTHLDGTLTLSNFAVSKIKKTNSYALEVVVQDQHKKTEFAKAGKSAKFPDAFTFNVKGNGVTAHLHLHIPNVHILPLGRAEWNVAVEQQQDKITLTIKRPYIGEEIGKITFNSKFVPNKPEAASEISPIPLGDRGYKYADFLPILDPNAPLPPTAKPTKAYSSEVMERNLIMGATYIDWTLRGAIQSRKTLPQPLNDRVDNNDGDVWWTNRRINGDCSGFIQPNPDKNAERPWDFQIEWAFNEFLDISTDLKAGVNAPIYICARFLLQEEGDSSKLVPHSIKYIKPKKPAVVVMADDSVKWKKAKYYYRQFEMNAQFTFAHVAIHFNIEQYIMAIMRNLHDSHPVYQLLTPHFVNVISNNRSVVLPKQDGPVTIAGVYTLEGQLKVLRNRFSGFSFKKAPTRVLPYNLENNSFENTQEVMWAMISQYVEEYFAQFPDLKIDSQIEAMSRDLTLNAINKTPGAMDVTNILELQQMCKYVIFQSIFYHAWIHWNNFDDFVPVLEYDLADPASPSRDQAAAAEDKSNMIQSLVTYISTMVKQWPIVDPELGGSQRLRELLLQNAPKVNPGIQIGTLIMGASA